MSTTNNNDKSNCTGVYVDGCYDLVHYGHANALRRARELADFLVIGVHSDADITKHKGPPVYPEDERYRLMKAIKWVDKVIESAPYVTTTEALDSYRCGFLSHGSNDPCVSADRSDPYCFVKASGRYKEFDRTEGISTTDLVSRILSRYDKSPTGTDKSAHTSGLPSQNSNGSAPMPVKGKSTWTDVGIPYMPNTLRIAQFCSATNSVPGPREPTPEDVVLYLPGTYDLFNIGHLSFFEKCLELGTYLLVGVHSDSNAIQALHERILSVLACRHVSNVIIDAPYVVPGTLLDHFKVNYVVVGKDAKLAPAPDGSDPMKVPKQRGIFKQIDSGCSVTTNTVIERIVNRRSEYEKRNSLRENKANVVPAKVPRMDSTK